MILCIRDSAAWVISILYGRWFQVQSLISCRVCHVIHRIRKEDTAGFRVVALAIVSVIVDRCVTGLVRLIMIYCVGGLVLN